MNCYLDTSALLKRYVDEPGSVWLRAQIAAAALLASSQLLIVEAISAFNRRVREGDLSGADYQRVRDVFREDCRTTYRSYPLLWPSWIWRVNCWSDGRSAPTTLYTWQRR